MKNFYSVFTLLCLAGMVVSLLSLFQSTNNDQTTICIWLFIAFGSGGLITMCGYEGIK
jgi:hypothetical protein